MRKAYIRVIAVRILVFSGLIGLSVALMQPVQSSLHTAIDHIRNNILNRIESETGLEVHFSSIRPSIFGSLDIRNLRISGNGTELVIISRTRVNFSLLELFKRNTAIKSIQLDQPQVYIDINKDREIFYRIFSGGSVGTERLSLSAFLDIIPEDIRIKINNGSIEFYYKDTIVKANDISFDISAINHDISLFGKINSDFSFSSFAGSSFNINTSLIFNGFLSSDFKEGSAQVSVSSLKSDYFELSPFNLKADLKNDLITSHVSEENDPFSLIFEYNLTTGNINAVSYFDNCRPSNLIRFYGSYLRVNSLFSQELTGRASFSREGGSISYGVNLESYPLAVSAYGTEDKISINGLSMFHGQFNYKGEIEYSPFAPSGTITLDRFSLTGDESITAEFDIQSRDNNVFIKGESISAGSYFFNQMDINIFPYEDNVNMEISLVCEDEGRLDFEVIYNYAPAQIEMLIFIDSLSAGYAIGMVKPFTGIFNAELAENLINNTVLNAEIYITTDFSNIVYNALYIDIKNENTEGVFSFSGTNKRFTLTEGIITRNGNEFLLSAGVNFNNNMDIGFSVNASFHDLSWHIEGQVLDRNTLIIQDPNGLHVYGNISNTGSVSGFMEGINFPVPVYGQPVYLNFYISLRYSSADFWYLDINEFEARNIYSPERNNGSYGASSIFAHNYDIDYLRISGVCDQDGASFREVTYSDKNGSLWGTMDFSWNSGFSDLQFKINITDGLYDGEKFSAEGILKDSRLSADASVINMRLDRFVRGPDAIIANAGILVNWESFESFNMLLALDSLYIKFPENELNAGATLSFTNDELSLYDLNIDYDKLSFGIPILHINRKNGNFAARANIEGIASTSKIKTGFSLDGEFLKINSWLDYRYAVNNISGNIYTGDTSLNRVTFAPSLFTFKRENGSLSVSGGLDNMLRIEMDNEGIFYAGLSGKSPIHTSAYGSYKNGHIDARCSNFYIDLASIWALTPGVPVFSITGGYATAQADIRGPLINPGFYGTGRAASLRIEVPDFLTSDILSVPFNIQLEGNEMVFNSVPAASGTGGGIVDGWLRFENWIPKDVGLDITVPRDTPIPYDLNVSGFAANGDISGRLFITLDEYLADITGDLYANKAEASLVSEDNQEQNNIEDPNALDRYSVVNLSVTTGPAVEFVWPNINMPIIRATPRMGTIIKISADTESGQYSIDSDIIIRSGELYYFDRNFYVRQGSLVLRENEMQFNPVLNAVAEIRDRTDTGPVTISMIVENEGLFDFVPRFEANPSLTQLEIYSLLGYNLYGAGGIEDPNSAQHVVIASTTDYLTQFIMGSDLFNQVLPVRRLERQIRNFLHLDMFSVRTKFFQNAVIDVTTSNIGSAPVDRGYWVGNYFNNSTVFIGKYVGQDMFIQFLLTMSQDKYNLNFGGLSFKPDIGIEMQSPLFNIRWDFFPSHPENWWVNDHSITLTWSKTFK